MFTLYSFRNEYGYVVYASSDNGNNARAMAKKKLKEYAKDNGYNERGFWNNLVGTTVHHKQATKGVSEVHVS